MSALAPTEPRKELNPRSHWDLVATPPLHGFRPERLRLDLRKRLQAVSLAAGSASAFWVLVDRLVVPSPQAGTMASIMVTAAFSILQLVMAALLSRRSWPERVLRAVETAQFGTATLFVSVLGWIVLRGVDLPRSPLGLLSWASALPHALLMVAYAQIPNSARRCARHVVMLAGTGLLSSVLTFLDIGARGSDLFVLMLVESLWLGFAAVLVVLGAYRVENLAQKATTAAQLGPYQLKERLGAGGMGEVYLAEHSLLRRPCAVKVIRDQGAEKAGLRERFEREVQMTATLTHPNTVQVYDYGRSPDGTFYYAMEYIHGITLEELVHRDGPLTISRCIRFLTQLCGALREAHTAGLVHRDVKPSNVMVCMRGGVSDVIKLLDFGLVLSSTTESRNIRGAGTTLSDPVARLTAAGTITGTPDYMSPEQAVSHGRVDHRSDIYSLGALGYFLLTGKPPFVYRSIREVLWAHLFAAAPDARGLRPSTPGALAEILSRCLAKEPSRRFASMLELEKALRAAEKFVPPLRPPAVATLAG